MIARWVTAASLLVAIIYAASEEKKAPPPFFLQDPTDSLCMAGEEFRRCSIETLFYVVGAPGKYQIHKRTLDGTIDEEDDGLCIAKKDCKSTKVDKAKLAKCSHCGAKDWNILGDADTGYVLSQNNGQTCLVREKGTTNVLTAPCDDSETPFVPLQLQFASPNDIKTMSSPGARLISAAHDGDKHAIQSLLKEGVDISVRDWDELTALIPAASAGHLDIVKLLVKEGIDVNAKDKDGITALMEASIMGHSKIVELLLENGAEIDAVAGSEVSALWLAASEGKVDCMHLLLNKGADAKNTRVDGISALMTASAGGHVEAVKLLLDHGADPTAPDRDGLTPLMNAAESGNVEVLKLLAENVNDAKSLDSLSNSGFNALIIAAAHGHAKAIDFLLTAGANVAAVHDNGVTALMYAAASNHTEAMKVLIEKGQAELDFRHTNGGTALLEASTGGAYEAMKYLVEKGAEYNFVDKDGVSPLMAVASQGSLEGQQLILNKLKEKMSDKELKDHINMLSYSGGTAVMFAAAGGHTNCTKQLIELGADVKAIARATPDYLDRLRQRIAEGTMEDEEPHVDGVTALHVAAQGGHLDCVKLLLNSGADVFAKDDEERTPLVLAIKGNYGEVAVALVRAGADPNTVYVDDDTVEHNLLFDAIMVENEEFAKVLIDKGADLYYKDDKKVSTLLQASHRGFTDIVQMLVDKHVENKKGGYLDETSEDGITPLIAASSEGHAEVVKALIAAKADINVKDSDETSALMAASARGHVDVVRELLNAGANVNDQNQDGHTALMFAYNGKNQVETLMERYNQFVRESEEKEDVDDGGTGPIIREALSNHTTLVEMLLKHGANPKISDKEGHTAKDFDHHANADAKVLDKEAKAEKIRDESKNEL